MKRKVYGKTVYVFGAGASYHVGAPLLNDFLAIAQSLYHRGAMSKDESSFELVFEWIESLKGASYYVDIDLDNVEHVFSLAEMQSQIRGRNGSKLYNALKDVIVGTLDESVNIKIRNKAVDFTNSYSSLGNKIRSYQDDRKIRNEDNFADSLISFNYDPILDFSVANIVGVNYCLDKSEREGIKLLKLHGSTNWGVCTKCKKNERIIQSFLTNYDNLYNWLSSDRFRHLYDGNIPFNVQLRVLGRAKCSKCAAVGTLVPFIIPPTWSKRVTDNSLRSVWGEIVNELKSAYQLIVIGYSMPLTDTFFQYLLTLGLQNNTLLNRVIIVNPDASEQTQNRYGNVFSRSMSKRGRIYYEQISFEKFVMSKMDEYQFI